MPTRKPKNLPINPAFLRVLKIAEDVATLALEVTRKEGDVYLSWPAEAADTNRTGKRFIKAIQKLSLALEEVVRQYRGKVK